MNAAYAIVDELLAQPHWNAQFSDPWERAWFREGLAMMLAG